MTEAEWCAHSDPLALLDFVRLRATDRQLRLFACACCRLLWDQLPADACRGAVELGERCADGLVGEEEMDAARREYNRLIAQERGARARLAQVAAAVLRARLHPWLMVQHAVTGPEARLLRRRQCDLLRDIVTPFRRLTVPGDLLKWNDGTVRRIAEGIYEERAFDRLPILHDALLDAGCDDEALLAHCRSAGPHVRGCWAIDLIRGKE